MPHGSQTTGTPVSITRTLVSIATAVVIAGVLPFIGSAERTSSTVTFTSPHRYMIVVPVRINGVGPYSFLLDTGATSSSLDPELSSSLNLTAVKSTRVASWEDTTDASRVFVRNLSLGSVDSGPLALLVQSLGGFKQFDSQIRGVLGQDVLLRTNFLIDNRHHRIQFDPGGDLLSQLTGERISIAPVRTRTGDLQPRLIAIPVHTALNTEPLYLLLDSGADMVVLEPDFVPPAALPRGKKWIADQNGKMSAATALHTNLSVGQQTFSAEVWIGETGLKFLAIDGLLPTGSFDQIYIANQGSFVILDPGRTRRRRAAGSAEALASPATP